jgi:hypothetical protein
MAKIGERDWAPRAIRRRNFWKSGPPRRSRRRPLCSPTSIYRQTQGKPADGYQAGLSAHVPPHFGSRKVGTMSTAEMVRLHNPLKDRPCQTNRLVAGRRRRRV